MIAMLLRTIVCYVHGKKKRNSRYKSYAQAQGQPAEFATLF